MGRPFVKMNGLGNDFVVVEARDMSFRPDEAEVRAICDRETGQGCDQLIAIEPGPSGGVFMRVWNADGSEVQTCGNALRCVGWLLMQASGETLVDIETAGGFTRAMAAGDHRITVDMGRPGLGWDEIPLEEEMDTRGIELQVGPIDDPVLHTPGAVSMGNPHVVFFGDRDFDDAYVTATGSMIERHPLFPEGVNVGFARVLASDRMRLRVWERGAGLTKACGTGACAALVAAARKGLMDRKAVLELDGGEIEIEWLDDDRVLMTGPIAVERTGMLA